MKEKWNVYGTDFPVSIRISHFFFVNRSRQFMKMFFLISINSLHKYVNYKDRTFVALTATYRLDHDST